LLLSYTKLPRNTVFLAAPTSSKTPRQKSPAPKTFTGNLGSAVPLTGRTTRALVCCCCCCCCGPFLCWVAAAVAEPFRVVVFVTLRETPRRPHRQCGSQRISPHLGQGLPTLMGFFFPSLEPVQGPPLTGLHCTAWLLFRFRGMTSQQRKAKSLPQSKGKSSKVCTHSELEMQSAMEKICSRKGSSPLEEYDEPLLGEAACEKCSSLLLAPGVLVP
jgi:hypothetical protein